MTDTDELASRLAALEDDRDSQTARRRPSAVAAVGGVVAIAILGGIAFFLLQPEPEVPMVTATAEEFPTNGDAFGAIKPAVSPAPPPAREPETAEMPAAEPNAELLERLEALQTEIAELRAQPSVEDDDSAQEAIDRLTTQIADLQVSSEEARSQLQGELAERDREIERLRTDLELAQLQQSTPAPLQTGPSEEELRLAELERRRAEETAALQARIESPIIAYGGGAGAGGADDTALSERTLSAAADFVANGALPSQVTQAEVIANPSNTVVQGTMIQAVTETALDSSLPGAIRATISEDVHAYDGSRVLIPRGSRLIGRYRSGLDIGQRRVTIAWDRIILPNNQSVQISAFGGDELGRSGTTGFVNTRFRERFGSAALISIIGAVPSAAASQIDDDTAADLAEDVGDDLTTATDSAMGEYLSISPVIHIDQGARITVMVDRDLEIF